jgi:homoserine dehydrogenase
VQEPEVTTFGIAGIRACDIGAARKMHRVVKLMASARLLDSGDVACYLEPAMMPQGMHEAAVPENFNLISITGMHIGKQSFYGQGAGRFPTAYNVMQDCLDIRNGLTRFYTDKLRPARVDNSSIMRPYYVRVNGMDRWLQTRIDKMLDCGIITTPVAVSEIHAWARERKLTETGGFLASLR